MLKKSIMLLVMLLIEYNCQALEATIMTVGYCLPADAQWMMGFNCDQSIKQYIIAQTTESEFVNLTNRYTLKHPQKDLESYVFIENYYQLIPKGSKLAGQVHDNRIYWKTGWSTLETPINKSLYSSIDGKNVKIGETFEVNNMYLEKDSNFKNVLELNKNR